MNVVPDHAFGGDARRFLLGGGQPFLPQNDDGLFHVAFRFDERVFAVHHSGSGLFPELFYMFGGDLH